MRTVFFAEYLLLRNSKTIFHDVSYCKSEYITILYHYTYNDNVCQFAALRAKLPCTICISAIFSLFLVEKSFGSKIWSGMTQRQIHIISEKTGIWSEM